ncbi:MAG: LytR/AlgR family response regulator transcription factor [Chitinophagales bacterium]
MKMQCMIVDDELMARKSLERLCGRIPELEVVQVCESAEEALEFLKKTEVDLVFLDVEMPGLTGLELLDSIAVMPQIIFTTSKTEYAFEAFQYEATDYVQKPVRFPRLNQAVQKAVKIYEDANKQQGETGVEGDLSKDEIYIKDSNRYVRIKYDDILYIEISGDYATIFTSKNRHIVHSTLKNMQNKLPPSSFLKVHRSYIVNLTKIVDIEDNSLLIGDKIIPISRSNKPVLMDRLNLL